MATRADAAGSTSYDYDNAGRLEKINNSTTGVELTYSYNTLSQPLTITHGTGGNVRWFGYDDHHRLAADELKTPGGTSIAKIAYEFDLNGNETRKTTTGFAGAADNHYTYDWADRLTSWNNGSTTTDYAYDGAGNRLQSGTKTFTYDQRNRLATDNLGNSYTYTARGSLQQKTTGTVGIGTVTDANGQVIRQYTDQTQYQEYAYDGLGRQIRPGFAYAGTGNDLASDGTTLYTRTPTGSLVGESASGANRLAWTDLHTDVIAQFTANGTTLAGSTAYDPLGKVLATNNMIGSLGYQSEWTDTSTGRVNMHARWYNTDTGQFDTRDTWNNTPTPSSGNANRHAYANANPLTNTDPSGHLQLAGDGPGVYAKKAPTKVTFVCESRCPLPWSIAAPPFVGPIAPPKKPVLSGCQQPGRAGTFPGDREGRGKPCPGPANNNNSSGFQGTRDGGPGSNPNNCPHGNYDWVAPNCSTVHTDSSGNVRYNDVLVTNVKDLNGINPVDILMELDLQVGAIGGYTDEPGNKQLVLAVLLGKAVEKAAVKAEELAKNIEEAECEASAMCRNAWWISIGLTVAATILTVVTGGIAGIVIGIAASIAITVATDFMKGNINSWADLGMSALIGLGTGLLGAFTGGAAAALAFKVIGAKAAGTILGRTAIGAFSGAASSAAVSYATTGQIDLTSVALGAVAGAAGGAVAKGGCATQAGAAVMGAAIGSVVHSFDPDTEVLMADGSTKRIEDIEVGDQVKATDPETGKTAAKEVTVLHRNDDRDLADVTVKELATGHTHILQTTWHHPFWNADAQRWDHAKDLKPGTRLRDDEGKKTQQVVAVKTWTGLREMRDLTVADIHTYYVVAGTTPVLVHNINLPIPGGCGQPGLSVHAIPSGSSHGPGAYETIPASMRAEYGTGVQWHPPLNQVLCSYCRTNHATPIDHVEPRINGGDLTDANTTPACGFCNSSKRDRVAPLNPPPNYSGPWPPPWWPANMQATVPVPRNIP